MSARSPRRGPQAQATVRETTERLNAAAAERQRKLAAALAAETAAAERRIAAAKDEALAHLRDVAVEVARAAAVKIAGTELDPARAGAAVDDGAAGARVMALLKEARILGPHRVRDRVRHPRSGRRRRC